jgi:hypothetical protein
VADELKEISGNALELQKMADAAKDTRDQERLVARLEEMINNLRSLNQQAAKMFTQVSAGADRLRQELIDQATGISFHHPVAKELEGRIDDFERIAALALARTSHECDPANRSQRLKELLSRYTMEAERMVHLGMEHQQGTGDKDPGDVELFGGEEEGEFGDNVELF